MLLSELPMDNLKLSLRVHSLNTQVHGRITMINYSGRFGLDDPDIFIEWENGNKSLLWKSWGTSVEIVE